MEIFKKHANHSEEETENSSSPINSFERKNTAIEKVIKSVVASFKDDLDKKNSKNKGYVLWIDTKKTVFDDLLDMNANGLTLKEEIKARLSKLGFEIGSLELKLGKPEGDLSYFTEIKALDITMYLDIVAAPISVISSDVVMKARITLAPGSPAALKQPEGYEIDSKHVPYNIGRVIEPDDPINRVNDIEIVDDTYTVSRTQAHIGFSNELGYYIQREKGDYIRTKVIRKGDTTPEHKLASEYVLFPLFDSDIIELNGYVRLLFQVID